MVRRWGNRTMTITTKSTNNVTCLNEEYYEEICDSRASLLRRKSGALTDGLHPTINGPLVLPPWASRGFWHDRNESIKQLVRWQSRLGTSERGCHRL